MSKKETNRRFALVPHPGCVCPLCLMHGSNGFHYKHEFDPHGGKNGGTKKCKCEFVGGVNGKTRIEGYDPEKCYNKWQEAIAKPKKQDATLFTSALEADEYLRPITDVSWDMVTDEEKDAIIFYTKDSNPINVPIYKGEMPEGEALTHMRNLEAVIDKYEMPEEYVAYRGTDARWVSGSMGGGERSDGFADWLKRQVAMVSADSPETLELIRDELSGAMLICDAFTSTASALETSYYEESPIIMAIRLPKGTKAMYVEPQSTKGNTVGGESPMHYEPGMKKDGVGKETEIILQRGSCIQINSVALDNGTGKIVLDAEVVAGAGLSDVKR